MNPEILSSLVRGGEISMPDRIKRGHSPRPPVQLSEIEHLLAGFFRTGRWFPNEWHPHKQALAVYEAGVIERKGPATKAFSSGEEAAAYNLQWDLHLAGDLDGRRVIE